MARGSDERFDNTMGRGPSATAHRCLPRPVASQGEVEKFHRGGTGQAALKVLYLVANQHRPGRDNLTGRINGWKQILNTLTIHYGDRLNGNY